MKRLDDYNALWTTGTGMIAPVGSGAPVDSEEMSIALVRITAGGDPVTPHLHRRSTETYVVVTGQGLLTVNGETSAVGPGTVVLMEPGDVHSVAQTGEDVLEFWAVSTPPWSVEDNIDAEHPRVEDDA